MQGEIWFVSEINYTPLIWGACNGQTDGDWKQACGYHRLGEAGNEEPVMNQYGVTFWEDEKVLEMDGGNVNVPNAPELYSQQQL